MTSNIRSRHDLCSIWHCFHDDAGGIVIGAGGWLLPDVLCYQLVRLLERVPRVYIRPDVPFNGSCVIRDSPDTQRYINFKPRTNMVVVH